MKIHVLRTGEVRVSRQEDRDLKSAFPLLHFHACDDCAADEN